MFSVGQRVWHRDGQHSGKVLECVGDRVYVEQDNGAEADFRAGDLIATPPDGARPAVTRTVITRAADTREPARPAAQVIPNRTLTAADITPEHVRVLAAVPVRTLQAIAAVFERKPNAGKFSALDVAGKLNAITAITAIPYRVMRQHTGSPGELGLLMGKGLADSRRAV
jgi:hypothetical protein